MVHTLHMSKLVMYSVFKVLRNVYWASESPYKDLREASGTFRGTSGEVSERGASRSFRGGLRGSTSKRGFKVPSESLRRGTSKFP